jgi:DNA (cytosine-5)-methyltransferase 1
VRIVSLFAGCGGLDLGLHRAGHKIVHASDFDKDSFNYYVDRQLSNMEEELEKIENLQLLGHST